MPVFSIHYRSATNEHHHTEWVTAAGWTTDQTISCFEQRHPGATVLGIADTGNPFRGPAAALQPLARQA